MRLLRGDRFEGPPQHHRGKRCKEKCLPVFFPSSSQPRPFLPTMFTSPNMADRSVDFPEPTGPTMAISSPFLISKATFSNDGGGGLSPKKKKKKEKRKRRRRRKKEKSIGENSSIEDCQIGQQSV